MNSARRKFLSGAAFTHDDDRRAARRDLIDRGHHAAHRERLPDQLSQFAGVHEAAAQKLVLLADGQMRAQVVEQHFHMMRINGLAQIIVGSELYRLNRVFDIALAGDHDYRKLPAVRTDFAEHRQAVLFRQPQVEQKDLRVGAFN